MLKKSSLFVFSFLFFCCQSGIDHKYEYQIEKDERYPRWLISNGYQTDQTSGITYIGKDDQGKKTFLLADDVGVIHHLKIEADTVFYLSPVHFSSEVESFLQIFPKRDFEEITLDRYTGDIYLSIEGNRPDPKKFTGIFRLIFKDNNIFSDSIIAFERVNIKPADLFQKYLAPNTAYEGLAVDNKYIYLGLEGFGEKGIFADSSIIFIVDKENGQIIKEINTRPLEIATICGLFSDADRSILGIDRNSKNLFHIKFDEDLNISYHKLFRIQTSIPGYPHLDYVAALEAVTVDDDGYLYLVDDPWRTYFVPPDETLNQLDSVTAQNFKNLVPVIFRYKLIKKK